MWKRHRTKPMVFLGLVALTAFVAFAYSGPSGDRRFVLGCMIAFDLIVMGLVAVATVLRCPRCGADMGSFDPMSRFGHLREPRPRYVECRYCGCVVDRRDGTEARR